MVGQPGEQMLTAFEAEEDLLKKVDALFPCAKHPDMASAFAYWFNEAWEGA